MYDVTVDVGLCTSGCHDGKGEGEKKSIACLFCFVFFSEKLDLLTCQEARLLEVGAWG